MTKAKSAASAAAAGTADQDALIQAITDRVLAALGQITIDPQMSQITQMKSE